jgi:hypothetical protein
VRPETVLGEFRKLHEILTLWVRCTLTFSHENVPRVIASIEVVGMTSTIDGTWLWSWANDSLPSTVSKRMEKVRAFGEAENIDEPTRPTYWG